jgi:hypothetical protein
MKLKSGDYIIDADGNLRFAVQKEDYYAVFERLKEKGFLPGGNYTGEDIPDIWVAANLTQVNLALADLHESL